MELTQRIIEKLLKAKKALSRHRKVVTCMAALIVFVTAYMLILPAVTLDESTSQETPGVETNEEKSVSLQDETPDPDSRAAEEETGEDETDDKGTGLIEEKTELEFDGKGYTVKAEVDADAKLPEDVRLTAREIKENSKNENDEKYAYDAYCDEAVKAVKDKDGEDPGSSSRKVRLYDISFTSESAEGGVVEPAAPVKIRIVFDDEIDMAGSKKVRTVHFDDSNMDREAAAAAMTDPDKLHDVKKEVLETKTKKNDDGSMKGVSFKSDSFSVYGIVYTVDFSYEIDGEAYDFSLAGGGAVSLRDLLDALHVLDDVRNRVDDESADITGESFVSDIADVEFSDDSLISVCEVKEDTTAGEIKEVQGLKPEYSRELTKEQLEEIDSKEFKAPDWALISLKPFDTEETLTVTMKNGEVFTIKVTDAKDPLGLDGQTYIIANANYAVRAEESDTTPVFLKRSSISSDVNIKWEFQYVENVFPVDETGQYGSGGYYLYNDYYKKYMKITGDSSGDANRSITLVDTKEEASPLSVVFNEDKGAYRISNKQDGSSGYLNHFKNNNYFGVSTKDTDDSWMSLLDPDRPNEKTGKVGTWDIKSDGIVLKLFDYSGTVNNQNIDSVWGNATNSGELRSGTGINAGRSLLFSGSGLSNEGFNDFTGSRPDGQPFYSGYVRQGIVEDKLGSDGFPALVSENRVTSADQRSGGSLGYLFDNSSTANTKDAYTGENNEGLNGLLRKDKDGYYYYDSEENYAHLVGDTVELYDKTYEKNYGSAETKKKKIGFFPFNDYDSSRTEEKGPSGSVYNHQLGMTLSTEFVYPENGKVVNPDTGRKNDMIFEFSGDDDVWVFVDGVLVLDLGGVHQPIRGTINFSTGAVDIYEYGSDGNEYKSTKSTTIAEQFAKVPGKEWDTTEYSVHKLDFFFIERGGCDSNCAIKFNLLTCKTLTLEKEVTGLTEAERAKYKDEDFTFELCKKNTKFDEEFELYNTGDTENKDVNKNHTIRRNKDGEVIDRGFPIKDGQIKMKDGESVTITYLPSTGIFHAAEVDQSNMGHFNNPTAERYYNDEKIEDITLEESRSHKDETVKDWVTQDYELADTDKIVIRNNYGEKELTVQKDWADGNGKHTDETVKFTVMATIPGETDESEPIVYKVDAIDGVEFELKSSDDWTKVIRNLPAFTPDNKPITYSIKERYVDGYTTDVEQVDTGDSGKLSYVITNTPFEFKVKKDWEGVEPDDEALRNSKVKVTLGRLVLKDKAGTITIKKTGVPDDADFHATYTILDANDSSTSYGVYSYDAEIGSSAGKTVSVPPGEYVVKEEVRSEDQSYSWTHDPANHEIEVGEVAEDGHKDAVFDCTANARTGSLRIRSTLDPGGGNIDFSNVRYIVYAGGEGSTVPAKKADGSEIGAITFAQASSGSGYVIDGLKVGEYTVKETGVPIESGNYVLDQHVPDQRWDVQATVEEGQTAAAEFSSTYKSSMVNATVRVTSTNTSNPVNKTSTEFHVGDTIRISYLKNSGESISVSTLEGGTLETSSPVQDEAPGNNNSWNGKYHVDIKITSENVNVVFTNQGANGGNWSAMDNSTTTITLVSSGKSAGRSFKAVKANEPLRANIVPGNTSPSPADYGEDPVPSDSSKKYVEDDTFTTGNVVELTYGNWEKTISNLPATDSNGNKYYYYIKNVEESNMPQGTTCTVLLDENGKKLLAGDGSDNILTVNNTIRQTGNLLITKELQGDIIQSDDYGTVYKDKEFKVTIKNSAGKYLQSDKKTFGDDPAEFTVSESAPLTINDLPIDTYTVTEKTDAGDVRIAGYIWNSFSSVTDGSTGLEAGETSTVQLKNYYNEEYTPIPSNTNQYTDLKLEKTWQKLDGVEPSANDNIEFVIKARSADAYFPVEWNLYNGGATAPNEARSGIWYVKGGKQVDFTLERSDDYVASPNAGNTSFAVNCGNVILSKPDGSLPGTMKYRIPIKVSTGTGGLNSESKTFERVATVDQAINFMAQPWNVESGWVENLTGAHQWKFGISVDGTADEDYFTTVDDMVEGLIGDGAAEENLTYKLTGGDNLERTSVGGSIVPESATAENWKVTLKNLPKYQKIEGSGTTGYKVYKYEIVEIKVNGKPVVNNTTGDYNVTTVTEGDTTKVTNTEINKPDIGIIKIDETTRTDDNPKKLEGAEFKLLKLTGSEYVVFPNATDGVKTTDENGYVKFEDLPDGEYKIEESKAPEGYNKLTEDLISFKVANGEITDIEKQDIVTYSAGTLTFTVGNEPGAALPHSGGPGTTWIYILGALLTALAGIALVVRRRMSV